MIGPLYPSFETNRIIPCIGMACVCVCVCSMRVYNRHEITVRVCGVNVIEIIQMKTDSMHTTV